MHGVRATVMGLGRFGGGGGAARWLAARGAQVVVTDRQDASRLAGPLGELAADVDAGRITLRLGGHDERDFTGADLVVVNPAVPHPWRQPLLAAARAAGARLTTEIRLAIDQLDRRRVIGVTGSAGKSTTAAMIHHVLAATGRRAHLGGNIGGSLLGAPIGADDVVVLELSSAMLYWLGEAAVAGGHAPWSPHVAVLTNVTPNHLDWHETEEHYRRCKGAIFAAQVRGDHGLHGGAVPSPPIPLHLPGAHNLANARLAVAAVARVGVAEAEATAALSSFRGLPHRLELVADRGGVLCYNDSKSTTPDATRVAVESFADRARVHLLAGGYDKKIDLSSIIELAPGLGGFYALGATGRALADAARGRGEYWETLQLATERALSRMKPGDILLLSPGCASWDQYESYEHRGNDFKRLVAADLESHS